MQNKDESSDIDIKVIELFKNKKLNQGMQL